MSFEEDIEQMMKEKEGQLTSVPTPQGNDITSQVKVNLPPRPSPAPSIIEHKFMLTLTQYPNGTIFPKIFAIGQTKKQGKKAKKATKAGKQATIEDEEIY